MTLHMLPIAGRTRDLQDAVAKKIEEKRRASVSPAYREQQRRLSESPAYTEQKRRVSESPALREHVREPTEHDTAVATKLLKKNKNLFQKVPLYGITIRLSILNIDGQRDYW